MIVKLPETIFWSVTSRCNNSCIYCYADKDFCRLPTKKVLKLIKLFDSAGVKRVVISGGEPLLHPEIDNIIRLLHQKKIEICLDTNADFFDKHKNTITKYVSFVGFPIDFPSDKESFRNQKNFQNVLQAIKYLAKTKKSPKIRIGTVVTKLNYQHLSEICQLIKDYPINLWKIYQFIPIGEFGKKNKRELYIDEKKFLSATSFIKNKKTAFRTVLSTEKKRNNAYFFLEADGRVFLPGESKENSRGNFVGDIFDPGIMQKWLKVANYKNYKNNIIETF